MLWNVVEIALGVDGGHAARTCGGYSLTVDVILHVACGKHTGHAGARAIVGNDVAVGIEQELALEKRCVRSVPDGNEDSVEAEACGVAPSSGCG